MIAAGFLPFLQALGLPAQGVVLALVAMSIASAAVVVERGWGLWVARRDTRRFVPLALTALESGLVSETLPLAEGCAMSPEAIVVRRSGAGTESVEPGDRTGRAFQLARWAVDREIATLDRSLRSGLPILATIAATAPFVGLFGTVLGIIRAFDALGRPGVGLPGIALGIAEALVTTAFGLFVAIPATWAFNALTRRVDAVMFRARRFASAFLEALAARGGKATVRMLGPQAGTGPHRGAPGALENVKSDINITPLVDVVLVLLIIFMVLTPAAESALDLSLAQTTRAGAGVAAEPPEKKEQILLRVTSGHELFLNEKAVSGPELRRALEEVFAKSADRPLFFDADPGADYNRIVEILDECSAAGVARIAVVNRRPPRR